MAAGNAPRGPGGPATTPGPLVAFGHGATPDARFPQCVLDDLEAAGLDRAVSDARESRWSKILGTVRDADGTAFWLKVATHAYGRRLLHREASGYRELAPLLAPHFRTPQISVLRDDDQATALLLTEVAGRRSRVWQFPEKTVALLAGADTESDFGRWAGPVIEPLPSTVLRDHLANVARSFPFDEPLVLGPSHGDFSSWNLLNGRSGPPAILDFEYFAPERPLLFDDLHWFVGFLARRAIRAGIAALPAALVRGLPEFLWNVILRHRYRREWPMLERPRAVRVYLAAYLLAQSARYLEEQGIADAAALVGHRDYLMRGKLIGLFVDALGVLAR